MGAFMASIVHAWLYFVAAALLAPALVFSGECLVGLLPLPSRRPARATRGELEQRKRARLAVLVPAHDEEQVLEATLADVRAQLEAGDRLLVVADNCADGTADVARASGAEVVERFDTERRGKGFALAFGIRALAADPPEVLVVVDADCRLGAGCLSALARTVTETGRPAQGEYVLSAAPGSPLQSINALAFLVRNQVRPRGLRRMGGPCQLTGSGMAFPFSLAPVVETLGPNIVEDLVFGIELACRGSAPVLCPEARVEGELPWRREAALGQRRRWEHGQLATLRTHGPRLLGRGFLRADYQALLLGLDLLVPPLSLLVLLEVLASSVAAGAALAGLSPVPLALLGGTLGLVGLSVLLAWARYGRAAVPMRHLLAAPFYVAWKIPLYAALLVRRAETRWVRTRRNAEESSRT